MVRRFPVDVEQQIQQRLASGRYASEDEVLRQALEELKLSDELAEFRSTIAESRAQAERGEKGPLDVDDIMERVEHRLSHPNSLVPRCTRPSGLHARCSMLSK